MKPVLLRIPDSLIARVDQVAKELGVSRTKLLLESVRRNLAFVERTELPTVRRIKEMASA